MAGVDIHTETAAAGDQIWVTETPEMLRIMRHEFSDGSVFDPKPLHKYLGTPTPEQVHLLMSYPKQKYQGKPRLVVFITLDEKGTGLSMCADKCDDKATPINSNSHFAVFHCDGEQKKVTLVCYTKEFNLFSGRPKALDQRNNPKPSVYKISTMNMSDTPEDDRSTLWHRVSIPKAGDLGIALDGGEVLDAKTGKMLPCPPNSMHGQINTKGCWMLFRNYNWYMPDQAQYFEIYRDYRKNNMTMTKELSDRLIALGYLDADGIQEQEKDKNKAQKKVNAAIERRFVWLEMNYAYTWFNYDVVGVDYLSVNENVNETNVSGSVPLSRFPEPLASAGNNYHETKKGIKMSAASLRDQNALGFKPAENLAPFRGKETYHLESTSWADLYVYTL